MLAFSAGLVVMTAKSEEISDLLHAWGGGDEEALGRLMPVVYERLRRIAHAYMRGENQGHPLQTTALVHEVYLRLGEAAEIDWRDRAHFYAVCAQMMRRILVDIARQRSALKRGGGAVQIPLDQLSAEAKSVDIMDLDDALRRLAEFDARKAQVVELREPVQRVIQIHNVHGFRAAPAQTLSTAVKAKNALRLELSKSDWTCCWVG